MKKNILIGSIGVVVILVLMSFTCTVNAQSNNPVNTYYGKETNSYPWLCIITKIFLIGYNQCFHIYHYFMKLNNIEINHPSKVVSSIAKMIEWYVIAPLYLICVCISAPIGYIAREYMERNGFETFAEDIP